MTLRNPIQNLPLRVMRGAVFVRLNGNIKKLDGVTVIPVYDAFPDELADRWNHIAISAWELDTDTDERGLGVFRYTGILTVFSDYNGTEEIDHVIEQMNSYLNSKLVLNGFTDVSAGGEFLNAEMEKVSTGEGTIARRVIYRRRWIVSDHKF